MLLNSGFTFHFATIQTRTAIPVADDIGTSITLAGFAAAAQLPIMGPEMPPTNATAIMAPNTVPVSWGKWSPAIPSAVGKIADRPKPMTAKPAITPGRE